jgi:hypothetical protein
MKLGNQTSWDFLFERYIAAFETATEQALMLTALGCSSDPLILEAWVQIGYFLSCSFKTQNSVNKLTGRI